MRSSILLSVVLLAGCASYPPGSPGPQDAREAPRTALPLPEDLARHYAPVHPGWGLRFTPVESGAHFQRLRFRFDTFSEVYLDFRTVEGTFYRTRRAAGVAPAPLVLVAPILGGAKDNYLACRIFGEWAAAAGMSSFYIHQDADILTGDRDAIELERLLRDSLLANRKTLDLLLRLPEVDPRRVGSLGISLGAVKNVVLIAVEPRLRANVLCLAGGDIPRILLDSRERMVRRYLDRRKRRDGLSPQEVAEEFRRDLRSEPLLFAPYIPAEKVLLFLGNRDDQVPYSSGLALHDALGRPQLVTLPLGHVSSILAAPFMIRRAFTWMDHRFQGE